MKKLHIDFGGHTLTAQGTKLLQEGPTEALIAFVSSFGSQFILSGIDLTYPTANEITWTAGWLFMDGELLQVEAGTIDLGVNADLNSKFSIVQTYESIGSLTYEDLTVVDTQIVRKATIVLGSGSGDPRRPSQVNRLKNFRNYSPLTLTSGYTSHVRTPVYGRTVLGDVYLLGGVSNTSFNTSSHAVIGVLPAAHRDGEIRRFICAGFIGGTSTPVQVEVDGTTGEIKPIGLTNGQNVQISLDSIRYSKVSPVYGN